MELNIHVRQGRKYVSKLFFSQNTVYKLRIDDFHITRTQKKRRIQRVIKQNAAY